MRVDPDIFDKALEKLWIHRGAVLDFAENATRGQSDWRDSYLAHGEQKRAQIELVIRFASSNQCRMSSLVRHFGDLTDGRTACGICDFCAPTECVAQQFRSATPVEREALVRVVEALRGGTVKSTGKLHGGLYPQAEINRDDFEEILGAMARAGLVRLADAVFEKDGKSIPYRKVGLTRTGQAVEEDTPLDFVMKEIAAAPVASKRKKGKKAAKPAKAARKTKSGSTRLAPVKAVQGVKAVRTPIAPPPPPSEEAVNPKLEEALRKWRLNEAKRLGVPAFRILTDRALRAIATDRPITAAQLLAIPGMGIATVEKYGHQLYRILNTVT